MNTEPVLTDAATHRANIRRKAIEGLQQVFPLKLKNFTLELQDPRVLEQDFSSRQQKDAILSGKTLAEKVQGTVVVKNSEGKIVDTAKNFTLLHLPYFTQRHDFVLGGNMYSVANQLRTKPGVYTRRRGNEELEAAFNLSRGSNFRVSMDPEKALLQMEYGTTRIPLYPVLKAFGVPHQDIAQHWGTDIANMNRDAVRANDKSVDKLYEKLIHPSKQVATTIEGRTAALQDYYANTSMDPEVTEKTLGHRFDRVSPLSLMAASKKLLEVHRNNTDIDDRDSLEFKTFHSVDDFIKERIQLDARLLKGKIGLKLDASSGNFRKAVPAAPFSKSVMNFLTGSSLSAVPTQINAMELLDMASKVTSLGEGAIANERAIPEEARNLHASHFGIIDSFRTPESFHAGIDVRTTLSARRDDAGNLYTRVTDVKTKKPTDLKPVEMLHAVVAFPGEVVAAGKMVDAMKNGEVQRVPASEVTHQIADVASMYGPTTNLLPFLNGMQGNRIIMASKHMSQAIPLVHHEAPLVQVKSWNPGLSVEQEMAQKCVPTSPVHGTVEKIDGDYIYIRPDTSKHSAADEDVYNDYVKLGSDDGLIKLHYDTNFPLAAKTYLHNDLRVKAGDKVTKNQILADSPFTKGDALALGRNLRVGYMAYRGMNSNDGLVISQGAADNLVSSHMYKSVMQLDGDLQASKEKHRTYFGTKYAGRQYSNLDEDGVVKPGTKVQSGDPLIVAVRKTLAVGNAALLGKLSKSLVKPYREEVELWTHDHEGEVIDVVKTPMQIAVTVKTNETINIGDKLSNRFGAKGVIAKIIPDHEMIQDEKGRPVDVLFTSLGIISRINPGQIVEAALGKVADHTGKPILVENFAPHDNVQYAKDMLAKHGLKDKETVFDPVTGKHIQGVFVGKSYILKLFKTTDSNWAAHGAQKYDINQQPSKGGDDGAKGIGKMEFDALLAHNARNILNEAASIKSQKNDEFWRAVQLGLPTPALKSPFAYDKFLNMLRGGGVNVSKRGSTMSLSPLTDNDILKMSSGVVKNSLMIRAKDLRPETGGLFDPTVLGGSDGTKFGHVPLHEKIVNPVFEEPVRRLLGLTQKGLHDLYTEKGGAHIADQLSKIDTSSKIAELRAATKTARGPVLDGLVKQIKYLTALKALDLTPDKAYVLSNLPIVPPIFRMVVPMKDGRLQAGDANLLYRDAMLANEGIGKAKGIIPDSKKGMLPPSELVPLRSHLYEAVGAVFGTHDPVSPTAEKRGAKGFLHAITGTRPGNGFYQSKLMKRSLDVSGRATISPGVGLNLDEVGVPEDMLYGMYSKFIIGRLVRGGYSALDAEKMVKDRHPFAKEQLLIEAKERPVIINRAPTLDRYGIVAAYPKIISGKTIGLNPFMELGLVADFDGDAVQIHAPVTAAGIADAKKMTLSNLVFSDKMNRPLNVTPEMESVMGLGRLSRAANSNTVKHFKNSGEALAAYHAGTLGLHDPVEIGGK